MRFTPFLTAALPIFSLLSTTIALPVRRGPDESIALRRRGSVDSESYLRDAISLTKNTRRSFHDFAAELEARVTEEKAAAKAAKKAEKLAKLAAKPARVQTKLPYKAKPKPVKLSQAAAKARKQKVRADHANAQAANAAKKAKLVQQAATAPRLSRPASAGSQKPNKPGYRAKRRKESGAMKKQPKVPKPPTASGTPRTLKSQRKQDAANQRRRERKAANRAHLQDAVTKYRAVGDLPERHKVYTAPQGEAVRGKDARTAVFNTLHFASNGPKHATHPGAKNFENRLQGPAGQEARPFPNMEGNGEEYPIVAKKGGYQGGSDKGPIRVVTQTNPADGKTKFLGVVGHDTSRKLGQPGYNDHFRLEGKTPTRS